jgi:hypothetical protein
MRLLIRMLIPVTGVALLAACGASSGTPAAASGSSSSAAADHNADTAAVTRVWESFFSKDTPIAQKETLLQNGGTTMKPAVQAFAADPRVGQVTATVQKVTFPAADQAAVTYQISLNGSVMLSGMAGKAVEENGHWLISDSTLCGLLQLAAQGGGSSGGIPGCS